MLEIDCKSQVRRSMSEIKHPRRKAVDHIKLIMFCWPLYTKYCSKQYEYLLYRFIIFDKIYFDNVTQIKVTKFLIWHKHRYILIKIQYKEVVTPRIIIDSLDHGLWMSSIVISSAHLTVNPSHGFSV